MAFNLPEILRNKKFLVILIAAAAIMLGAAGYMIAKSGKGIIIDTAGSIDDVKGPELSHKDKGMENMEDSEVLENKQEDEIKVYVTGSVKKPGIVTIKKGQLIDDAIKAAGGADENADLENINLVYRLKDNAMLYIYSKDDVKDSEAKGEAGSGIKIVRNSTGTVISSEEIKGDQGSKININTASASELETLPGIGQATSRDIIAYRESSGPFKSINDIMKVPGIKESRFGKIKDLITVD